MNEAGFILQALFFAVSSLAVVAIVWLVFWKMKLMEGKQDYIISMIRSIDIRSGITYINTLNSLFSRMLKEEKYEEAARLKKVIDDYIQWMDKDGKLNK